MKPRSEAAVYRRYVILSSFYNFLYTEGVIESLPILRKSILGKDLSYSFKNRVYNTSKSISTAAILVGNSPNTLYKIYKADLNERTADTAHVDPI